MTDHVERRTNMPDPDQKTIDEEVEKINKQLRKAALKMGEERGMEMAEATKNMPVRETLISFESGHYKKVTGKWLGDSVWMHFQKEKGGQLHVNKDKVEYCESF